MPFIYSAQTAQVATGSFATSATANTEVDHTFHKPGTRTIWIISLQAGGKGAALTSVSGIAYRFKKWTTTASSGGTAVTPTPRDPGAQAAKATCGMASAGVTSGTGGPIYLGGIVSGVASGNCWVAVNPDAGHCLEGSATMSIDLFTSQGGSTALNFEAAIEHME